jgi:hypothetical protein
MTGRSCSAGVGTAEGGRDTYLFLGAAYKPIMTVLMAHQRGTSAIALMYPSTRSLLELRDHRATFLMIFVQYNSCYILA